MSAPVRFLAIAIVGWAGIRAATLGWVPGSEMFTIGRSEATEAPAPAIAMTQFPPIEPVQAQYASPSQQAPFVYRLIAVPQPVPVFYRQAIPAAPPAPASAALPFIDLPNFDKPQFYSPIPQLDDWPLSQIASGTLPMRRSAIASPQQSVPVTTVAKLDRLQLTAWALLRGKPGPETLATGGTLGGSQAGARLSYNLTRWLAGSVRTTSPVGGVSGGEVAAGVRFTPLRSIPLALTAERRQAIGHGAGRSAFALFLEGGFYQQRLPWKFEGDAYAQGGVVGVRSRNLFVDGGLTLTRPLFRDISGGFGVWGGAQTGLYRIDVGPRVSMRVRQSMRVHLDWRQRVSGNAAPGSGPALTLAADF